MNQLPSFLAFADPLEPFEPYSAPVGCGGKEKPGTAAFRDFILSTVGIGRDVGIMRCCDPTNPDCGMDHPSEHHVGRAWDWGLSASNPEQAAAAQLVLDWLLAPDAMGNQAAMFRRVGLIYIIWNRQSWHNPTKGWQTYTGKNPHTDHVHFSFGVPGAMAQTSFYRWLGTTPGVDQPPGVEPIPGQPEQQNNALAGVMGFALGAGIGYIVGGQIAHIRSKIG